MNEIYIESKASSKSNGQFHFSRYAWTSAKKEKNKYFIYLWIKNNTSPRIINYEELVSYLAIYDNLKETNAFWQKIRIVPTGKD